MENKAKELYRILGHIPIGEFSFSVDMAYLIYSMTIKKTNDFQWAIGSLYQAGKIEGIREERARRKAKYPKVDGETNMVYKSTDEMFRNQRIELGDIELALTEITELIGAVQSSMCYEYPSVPFKNVLSLAYGLLVEQKNKISKLGESIAFK